MSEFSKQEDNGSIPTTSEETSKADGRELEAPDAAATEPDERSDSNSEPENAEPPNSDANSALPPREPTPMIRHVYHPTRGGFSNYQRSSAIRAVSIIESISSHSYGMYPVPYQFPTMQFTNFVTSPIMNMHVTLQNTMSMESGVQHFSTDFLSSTRFTQVFTPPPGPHFYAQLEMEYQLLSEQLNANYGLGYPQPLPQPSNVNGLCSATVVVTSTSWFKPTPRFRPNRNKSRRGRGSSRHHSARRGTSFPPQFQNSGSGRSERGGHSSSFNGTYSRTPPFYRHSHELIVNPVPWVASDTLVSTNGHRMRESSGGAGSTSEDNEPSVNSEFTYENSFPPLGKGRRGKKGKHSANRQKGKSICKPSLQIPPPDPESTESSSDSSVVGNVEKSMTSISPEGTPAAFEEQPPQTVGTFTRSWADVAAGVMASGPYSLEVPLDMPGPSSRQQETNATFQELQDEADEYAFDIDIEILQNEARAVRQMIQEDMEQQLEQNACRNALRLLEELEEEEEEEEGEEEEEEEEEDEKEEEQDKNNDNNGVEEQEE